MVNVIDMAYIWNRVTDLDKTEKFLTDFGLVTVSKSGGKLLMRATGRAPYCYIGELSPTPGLVAIGLRADPKADLVSLTHLPGAGPVEPLPFIGGGKKVRLISPSGFNFDVVQNVIFGEELPYRKAMALNPGSSKVRINQTQRLEERPAQILRLGHCALVSPKPMEDIAWMQENFGFLISDYVNSPADGSHVGAFIRADRGDIPVDHHILGVFPGPGPKVHHYSFELEDLDSLAMGNKWLRKTGQKHFWGIGRHVLGSQIFDYWRDPDGMLAEHYTDGDVFDASEPIGEKLGNEDALCSWGPPLPADFLE